MGSSIGVIGSALSLWFFMSLPVGAAERLALLIGNQLYNENVGPLTNPYNDIDVVGAALEKLNFNTTKIRDATFATLQKAIRSHIARVREAGPNTISFVYYSGHGAADATTRLNYLIPVDAPNAEDTSLWENSVELKGDVIDKLVAQAPTAVHFVVFDACRNELQLKVKGKKAFEVDGKGFVPIEETGGILVAFATAAKRTATDAGIGGGPYARALAEELVRPGVEAVIMFRQVELRIWQSIGQRPWWNATGLQVVYLAGPSSGPPASTSEVAPVQAEKIAFERERAAEKKTMQSVLQQIGDAGIKYAGLFHSSKKWPKRNIEMCFLDGSRERRAYVASIARQWTLFGEIDFDFGSWDDPRACGSAGTPHDVAITFVAKWGNWSYMGTDSKSVPPNQPTLGLSSIGLATDEEVHTGKFNREILHEFGHAIGFDHAWKAPSPMGSSSCDQEFDWNRIYEELGKEGWTKQMVDTNIRSAPLPADVTGAFDKNSVMNNELPPDWFLRGLESPCYMEPRNELSLRDKLAVFTIYR